MTFVSSYTEPERDEVSFSSELGWLAALAFAIVGVITTVMATMP
jgi:hypothetical protein